MWKSGLHNASSDHFDHSVIEMIEIVQDFPAFLPGLV
jgi:hypothetical protein